MNLTSTNWNIITGGPSSGKSTTLNAIAYRGYKTIPEAARILIDEEMSNGKSIAEIRSSEILFQERVLKMKIELEEIINPNELIFLDRGILDSIPYFNLENSAENILKTMVSKRKYNKVFLLDPVPFKKDYARIESSEKSVIIANLLYKTYTEMGYDVIKVPFITISQRVDFILTKI